MGTDSFENTKSAEEQIPGEDIQSSYKDRSSDKNPERAYKDYQPDKKFMQNKYFLWGLTGFLTVVACILVYLILNNIKPIYAFFKMLTDVLMPVFVGMIIAYLLTPVLNFIECKIFIPLFNKTKIKETKKRNKVIRGICIFITIILMLAAIFWMFYLMISQIVPSIKDIANNLDTYQANIQNWARKTLTNNPDLRNNIIQFAGVSSQNLETWINDDFLSLSLVTRFIPFINKDGSIDMGQLLPILSSIIGGLGKFFGGLWNAIIGMIISIYLMAGKERFAARSKKLTYVVFNRKNANSIISAFRFTHKTFIGYLGGKIIDSIIIGFLCFIGTSIMQTPYAGLVSLFVGVTNIIPYFGPFLGAIPSALLIFVVDPMHPLNTLFFLIFILVLQQLDGNVIGPKILGDSTGLEGFWVIFSITLFGGFFKVPGMILGIPVFAVFYAGVKAWSAKKLKKKKLPYTTDDYVDMIAINDDGEMETFIPDSKKPAKKIRIPFVTSIREAIRKKKEKKQQEK